VKRDRGGFDINGQHISGRLHPSVTDSDMPAVNTLTYLMPSDFDKLEHLPIALEPEAT